LSTRTYPKYKDSGVEWLGQVPEHWELQPIFALFDERGETNEGIKTENVLSVMKDIGVINYEDKGDIGNKKSEDIERYKIVKTGDLVINSMNVIIGSVGVAREDGALSPVYIVLRARALAHMPFYGYVFQCRSFQRYLTRIGYGILEHRMRIPMINLKRESLTFPPLDEQRAIAAFLECETARLDTLIAKQERLIELSLEKRRALISHTVTRGLDANAPLKDSGIEWLGQVPESWKVSRVRFIMRRMEQGWSPQCDNTPAQENQWGVLKSGCVNGGTFCPQENKTLPLEIDIPEELEVHIGDVLMSRASGSIDLIGSVGMVKDTSGVRLLLSDKTFRVHLKRDEIDATFFVWQMNSLSIRAQIKTVISGAGGLANNIGQSDIKNLFLTLPPLTEQRAIVKYLDAETAKIDTLINKARRAIELMKEHRISLIAATVTGKIDVRERVVS